MDSKPVKVERQKLMRRVGECNRCGRCCHNIKTKVMLPDKVDIRVYYEMFGYHVFPDGCVEMRSNSKCRNLAYDGKLYSCGIEGKKPGVCGDYPWEPQQIHPYCGFRFEDVRNTGKAGKKPVA